MVSPSSLTRVFTWKTGARAVALAAFLFLFNAFIQSGSIRTVEAVVGLGWLALCYVLSARRSVPSVLVLTFLGCIAWGLFIESRPVSDWIALFEYSSAFSRGLFDAAFETKSFTTVVYGAAFHWLLGSGWATTYVASALAWVAGAALVYAAIVPFTRDERLARFVCFALALCPAFLVFSPVLGSIGVFFLMSAVCGWLVSKHLRSERRNPGLYAGLGAATALLYLTRPHGVLLLGVCLVIVAVTAPAVRQARPFSLRFSRDGAAAALIVAAVAASVVLAHGGFAYGSGHGFQLTSQRTGWVYLLYGANIAAGGMWNEEDISRVRAGGASFAEMDRRAREMALERLAALDVPEFTRFAFTTKMEGLYGRDTSLFRRAKGRSDRSEVLEETVQPAVGLVEAGVYRLVFLLFLALLAREVWRPSRLLLLGVIVLLYSLPHLLLAVDQRMHIVMLPYFVTGSALLAYEWTMTVGKRVSK